MAKTKQNSANIVPDVRRFRQLINADEVFGTHTGEALSLAELWPLLRKV